MLLINKHNLETMQKNIVGPKFKWSFKNLLFETIES